MSKKYLLYIIFYYTTYYLLYVYAVYHEKYWQNSDKQYILL